MLPRVFVAIRRLAAVCFSALLALPAYGATTTSNLEREKSWANEVVDTVVVGEPVWLRNRSHKFLALYAPPARPGVTAVILVHGRGVHPAWGFIDTLRSDLAEAGYHTLSVQMPILAADAPFGGYGATFSEAFERLTHAIRYLREHKGIQRVMLLGHSSGAMTVVAYTAKFREAPVAGIVAIGLSTFAKGPEPMQPVLTLRKVSVPVLDIYGSNDLHEVVSVAAQRAASARNAGNKGYRALHIPDADHFFTDRYEPLRKEIINWLDPLRAR
jgi:pimeloyl-ACP methyl ester carboxylesterase